MTESLRRDSVGLSRETASSLRGMNSQYLLSPWKAQQTINPPKPSLASRPRRNTLYLGLCAFLVGGCGFVVYQHYNLDAPSVSLLRPVDINWNHLHTERWGYTLHHDTRVAYFGFGPDGGVGATMGTRDETIASVTGIVYQWRIKTPTRLEFTDVDGVTVYFTFELNDLTRNCAVVTDVSNGEVLSFTRSFQCQTGQ